MKPSGSAAGKKVATSASEQQMVPHDGRAALLASNKMALFRQETAAAGTSAGYVTNRTLSGRSLGSLDKYSREWNLADVEVTSKLALPPTKASPISPNALARTIAQARNSLDNVERTASVRLSPSSNTFLQSSYTH